MILREIGIVRHEYSDDEVRDNAGKIEGSLNIYPEYAEGLYTIEKYERIFVITIMHKHLDEQFPLKVRPRLLLRQNYRIEDLPEIGVFATDSPSRPNPLGLTLLKIRKIDGNRIDVTGLDLFNETPIVDIKPYTRRYMASGSEDGRGYAENCAEIEKNSE